MKIMGIATIFGLSLLMTVSAYAIDPGDIVGAWLFDGDAIDSSGNGLDGTVVGGAEFVDGMIGQAINLNGTDAWVEVPDLGTFEQVTVATWAKCTGRTGAWRVIFTVNGWSAGVLHHQLYSDNVIGFSIHSNPGGNDSKSNFMFDDSQLDVWHHLATVYNSNEAWVRFYVDGELDVQNDWGGNPIVLNAGRIGSWDGGGREWQGMFDEFVILNTALSEDDIRGIMENGVLAAPELAANPSPEDAVVDVPRKVTVQWEPGDFAVSHDVYFGTTFEDVNEADRANPGDVLISEGQGANSYDAGTLAFGQTYYWRVDEVNGAPDSTVFKGETWSFTTEPFSIPITGIAATAASSFGASVAEKTIDGSGLTDDLHGTNAVDMWISGAIPATIEYAFDRAYKLHELWIWNSNQAIEAFVGFGAKDVVIEHSLDGETWTALDGVGPLAQATGSPDYAHNNTIDFGGVMAQFVRIAINSVQGIAPQASLSEVRFYFIPTFAAWPNPVSGATNVAPDSSLSWGRNGREADHHDVYVGADAGSLSLAGSVSESSLETLALDLQLGQAYAWRVDEVNEAMDPSIWEGAVWSFTTAESIPVDDMESYKDQEFFEIWATWVDGFDDPANGSLVGNGAGGLPETGIVHGGNQSLPMTYGIGAAALSEATRTFDASMDWTGHGVQGLVLWFQGSPDNTGGALYVRINDTRVAYDGDASNLMSSQWSQWYIPLANVAGDLSRVNSLTIGIDGGGAGVVYVDDISLVASAP